MFHDRGGKQSVNKWWICSLVVLCLAISGCTREEVDGNTTVFSNELWVGLVASLGGVALIAAGIVGFLAKGIDWLRRAALTLCVIGAGGLAFSVEAFTEKTTVAADKAVVKDATFCFGSSEYNLVFADMLTFDQTEEERRGRRGRKNHVTVYIARMRSGEELRFDTSPVLRHAMPTLVKAASDAGVPIGSAMAMEFGLPLVQFANQRLGGGDGGLPADMFKIDPAQEAAMQALQQSLERAPPAGNENQSAMP